MEKNLIKKVNFLMSYAMVSTVVICLFAFSSFDKNESTKNFNELTVKKLTVVGEDGTTPRIVLSNETRQHSGRMNGKDWPKRERPAGIIFFNNEGDECGGIIQKVKVKDGKVTSGMCFTMDNYKDDQVVQIINDEFVDQANNKTFIERGLKINQYPAGTNMEDRNNKLAELEKITDEKERKEKINALMQNEGSVNRLFIGRTRGNSSGLFLAGPDGQPKLMIYVDDKGNPKLQTFNSKGELKDFPLGQ